MLYYTVVCSLYTLCVLILFIYTFSLLTSAGIWSRRDMMEMFYFIYFILSHLFIGEEPTFCQCVSFKKTAWALFIFFLFKLTLALPVFLPSVWTAPWQSWPLVTINKKELRNILKSIILLLSSYVMYVLAADYCQCRNTMCIEGLWPYFSTY